MVSVTRAPSATAPTNSVIVARKPTWVMLKVLVAPEVAYELATSLAPLPKADRKNAIVVIARIQS